MHATKNEAPPMKVRAPSYTYTCNLARKGDEEFQILFGVIPSPSVQCVPFKNLWLSVQGGALETTSRTRHFARLLSPGPAQEQQETRDLPYILCCLACALQHPQITNMAAPSQLSPNEASKTTETTTKNEIKPSETIAAVAVPSNDVDQQQPSQSEAPILLKDPPLKDPPAALQELTYASTQSSDAFLLAKNLLQDGDFETALETIATYMSEIASLLPQEDASVHEAMAPLYYLYGTTLLYSIEESSDIHAMMLPTTTRDGNNDEEEPDDSQIAWENLETARHIVQRIVSSSTAASPSTDIQLDLAQIHSRLGDLLKANGNYADAIADYQACLNIRLRLLGPYDRKVASMYHALGLVYMMLASEGDTKQQDATTTEQEHCGTPAQMDEYRRKSIQMYVECAKSFAGQIAFWCGANPEDILADVPDGGGKTTGMDKDELALVSSSSNTVRAIRERVNSLNTTSSTTAGENQETVQELKELLDEIQETIDEVQTSKEGIKQVAQMKAKAKADVDGSVETTNHADGSTTTIGFGTSTVNIRHVAAATAVAPTHAAASDAKPMMMVVKKKRRQTENDEKMPAHGDDAKRAKTQE